MYECVEEHFYRIVEQAMLGMHIGVFFPPTSPNRMLESRQVVFVEFNHLAADEITFICVLWDKVCRV